MLERKKREEAEKKKKLEEKRVSQPTQPTVPKVKPPKSKDDDNDDPIAKSLKERMDAGGLTQVVKKAGDKSATKNPPTARADPKASKIPMKKEDGINGGDQPLR